MVRLGTREAAACWNVSGVLIRWWGVQQHITAACFSDQIFKTWQLDPAGDEEPSRKLSVLQGIQTGDNGWLWLFKFHQGEAAKV